MLQSDIHVPHELQLHQIQLLLLFLRNLRIAQPVHEFLLLSFLLVSLALLDLLTRKVRLAVLL